MYVSPFGGEELRRKLGSFLLASSSAGVPEIQLFGFPHLLYSLSAAIYSV